MCLSKLEILYKKNISWHRNKYLLTRKYCFCYELGGAGISAGYESIVADCHRAVGLEPAAVRVDGRRGGPPRPEGAQPVLRALNRALLPRPARE